MFNNSMTFDLGDDVNALRETVNKWAQARLRPIAVKIDKDNQFPAELWREMGDLGFLGVTVGEDYGGAGMSYLAHVIVVEEIARASASVSLSYGAHSNLCVNQINLLFNYLLSNGYSIDTSVTKIMQDSDVKIQNLICFISKN